MQSESTAQAGEAKLHFLDYLRIIRIRKMIILMVWLLVIITTVVVTNWLPKTYMSTVRMDVQKDAADVPILGSMQTSSSFDPYFIQTQFERIKSISVLYPVIEKLNLNHRWAKRYGSETDLKTQETYAYLDKRMDVRNVRQTSIIEIRLYSDVPEEAAEIAQAIAELYRDKRLEQNKQQSEKGIVAIREQLKLQDAEIKEMQAQVDKFRNEAKITDIGSFDGGGQSLMIETTTALRTEDNRIAAKKEYITAKTRYDELLQQTPVSRRQAILTIQYDDGLSGLLQKLTVAEQDRVGKEKDFGPTHPEMQRVVAVITEINKEIDERVEGLMNGLKTQAAAAEALYKSLNEDVIAANKKTREAQEASQNYMLAKRDLEAKKNLRDGTQMKIATEEINRSIGRLIVDIIDTPQVGLKPVRPSMFLNVTVSTIVGLILGIGLAFFIEYLDTSVKTIDDVERALGAPVLGVIPQNVGVILEEGPESPHAEAYRVLRTNLIFSQKDPNLNTITVVSGGAGEGKSTTILNLATIFAQNGQRVLLVDSDLRRPSLHKRLNLSNSLGLTNYLLQQNKLEEVIQTTKLPGLSFLPSGRLPSSSLGILNSPQMKAFITEIKKRYDYVFFDSPPIMGVSDASILVSEMDLSLLVIQYRKYPQAMTIRSKQMIEKVGGNLVGVILNNINISQDAYYYYYSGGAYNDYTKQEDEADAKADKKLAAAQSKADIKSKY